MNSLSGPVPVPVPVRCRIRIICIHQSKRALPRSSDHQLPIMAAVQQVVLHPYLSQTVRRAVPPPTPRPLRASSEQPC